MFSPQRLVRGIPPDHSLPVGALERKDAGFSLSSVPQLLDDDVNDRRSLVGTRSERISAYDWSNATDNFYSWTTGYLIVTPEMGRYYPVPDRANRVIPMFSFLLIIYFSYPEN